MAKLCSETNAALMDGFNNPQKRCPFYKTSPCGEAWMFGQFLQTTGRSSAGIEKRRGGVFETPFGSQFKAVWIDTNLSFSRIK